MPVTEAQLLSLLRAEGMSHPLMPIAVKIIMESFQSGERYLTNDLPLGPLTMAIDPVGELAATLGKLSRGEVEASHNTHDSPKPKRTRKKTATDRIMKRALREANAKARKKNGDQRSPYSRHKELGRYNRHIRPILGTRIARTITTQDLNRIYNQLQEDLSPSTI